MPFLSDFRNIPHGTSTDSKLDLAAASQQIPMDVESKDKTAVSTPFGLFRYNYMPFGLCNAAQTHQRLHRRTNELDNHRPDDDDMDRFLEHQRRPGQGERADHPRLVTIKRWTR